jgi:HEAT repeat protein
LVDQEEIHNQCLSNDLERRKHALEKLNILFSSMPDKQQAWNDLHRLTSDENSHVKYGAARALGSAFSQVPDKQQAWNDLHRLISDKNNNVRISSNYSLGRVSIFMASQAETDEDYRTKLEKAIEFFYIAAKEAPYNLNPSHFCLLFIAHSIQ